MCVYVYYYYIMKGDPTSAWKPYIRVAYRLQGLEY